VCGDDPYRCQLCQALSKCFCVFANCEIVSCFAEISFLQCKPDAEEWVPYTIAVQVLASLHLCHHAHPHVLKTQCNNNINSTTQLYMIKSKEYLNKEIKKKHPTREQKKKGSKSKQKTTPKSAEHTMGNPKSRNHKT